MKPGKTAQLVSSESSSQEARFRFYGRDGFALLFGVFLGLSLWKFGNPIVLDSKMESPGTLAEFLAYPWLPGWSIWFLIPFALLAGVIVWQSKPKWPASKWLWILPLVWFGWQWISATQTVDRDLTAVTLRHFGGLTLCFFIGVLVLNNDRLLRLLLIGLMAAFAFCLVQAVKQKLFEFPAERQFLVESEKVGWTNVPPEIFFAMKESGTIITTNGVDIANPIIVRKFENGRVFGTLVYPNALAGAILLLFPVAMMLAVRSTRRFRSATRWGVIGLTLFLGLGSLIWTGSKSGWLIALAMVGIWLLRLNWSRRFKWMVVGMVCLMGFAAFAVRFQSYFAAGATSVGARFDYWRAAVQTTAENPVFGTGPGTFQRPYEKVKAPESEMARLAHNDYLEQFSDSGIVGGVSYLAWIVCLLIATFRRISGREGGLEFAVFLGCLGWLGQGLSEFSMYIPALSWTAFVLAGCILGLKNVPEGARGMKG